MKAYTYIRQGEFGFTEKEKPVILDSHDAIVKVTLSCICTSDLHIKHGSPNAIVTIVAMYDKPQMLPLPDMYGKNLTFKTGGVDGCDCEEILKLIEQGKIDTTPLITHRFPLSRIEEAYDVFENKKNGVIKTAIYPG